MQGKRMYEWRRAWVHYRKDRRTWCVDWIDPSGRRFRRAYPDRATARAMAKQITLRINQPMLNPTSTPWPDLLAEYMASQASRSASTRAKTEGVLTLFTAHAKPAYVHSIRPHTIEAYFAARLNGTIIDPKSPAGDRTIKPVSRATLHGDFVVLHALFAYASHSTRGYCQQNPLDGVQRPPIPRRAGRGPSEPEWLSLLETVGRIPPANTPASTAAAAAVAHLDDRQAWHILILLAVVTGLRRDVLVERCYISRPPAATLSRLRHENREWSWVELLDDSDGGIALLHAYSSKSGKESIHGLPRPVADRIATRISDLPDGSTLLFPWSAFQRGAWRRINAAAHLDYTFQSLRQASVTRVAVDQARRSAQAQAHHSSLRTTMDHYLDDAAVQREVARSTRLPDLPPLPPFPSGPPASPGRRPIRSERLQ